MCIIIKMDHPSILTRFNNMNRFAFANWSSTFYLTMFEALSYKNVTVYIYFHFHMNCKKSLYISHGQH